MSQRWLTLGSSKKPRWDPQSSSPRTRFVSLHLLGSVACQVGTGNCVPEALNNFPLNHQKLNLMKEKNIMTYKTILIHHKPLLALMNLQGGNLTVVRRKLRRYQEGCVNNHVSLAVSRALSLPNSKKLGSAKIRIFSFVAALVAFRMWNRCNDTGAATAALQSCCCKRTLLDLFRLLQRRCFCVLLLGRKRRSSVC